MKTSGSESGGLAMSDSPAWVEVDSVTGRSKAIVDLTTAARLGVDVVDVPFADDLEVRCLPDCVGGGRSVWPPR